MTSSKTVKHLVDYMDCSREWMDIFVKDIEDIVEYGDIAVIQVDKLVKRYSYKTVALVIIYKIIVAPLEPRSRKIRIVPLTLNSLEDEEILNRALEELAKRGYVVEFIRIVS